MSAFESSHRNRGLTALSISRAYYIASSSVCTASMPNTGRGGIVSQSIPVIRTGHAQSHPGTLRGIPSSRTTLERGVSPFSYTRRATIWPIRTFGVRGRGVINADCNE